MTKKNLSNIFTGIILVAFAVYFTKNTESFKPLLGIPVTALAFIFIAKLFRYVSNGVFIQWTVEVFTKKFSLKESVYIATLSAVGNFFGPLLGGTTIRAVYPKKVHKLSYSFFTSTLAGYYVILFGIGSFLGLVSLLLIDKSIHRNGLLAFFTAWFLVMLALMFIKLPKRERFSRFENRKSIKFFLQVIYDIEKGWHKITRSKNLLIKLALLGFSGYVITYLTVMVEFWAIGVSVSPAALGLYTAISSSAILVSFTPGAIGIKEGLLIVNASVMGVTNDQILQVAVIDRGLTFILIAVLYLVVKKGRTIKT